MLKPGIQDALNDQINAELFSSYLYLSMAAHFESKSLPGMANWMRIQAQEELTHAMKFYDFINDRGGRVILAAVEAPQTEWDGPLSVFEGALEHERKVTGLIHDLVELAVGEKDRATEAFLQWFVNEQVEEEATAETIVDQLKLIGDNGVALFMLDGQLGQRSFTATAQ
jgi:ferritin